LAAETLLSYPVASSRLDVVRQFLQPAQLVPKRIRQADNTLMLVQMAAAGWGVTVLPSWVSREFEAQGLVVSRSIGAGLRSRLFGALRARERDEPGYRELFRQIRLTAAQQL
jgi:LysR family transcriptional regulator, regulator for metE and metH